MSDSIRICLISDEAYGRHLTVTLASIITSAAPGDSLVFYIVDGGISSRDKAAIEALTAVRPFVCHYLTAGEAEMRAFPRHRCAPCAYYRVLLPEILPDLDKLIYLDCDLIVLKSLRELWATGLGDRGLAAARDFIDYVKDESVNFLHQLRIGMDIRRHYFNSGVMLLNLAKMRDMGFQEVFFRVRRELDKVIRFSDQDIFNHIFQDDLVLLPQGWNFQTPLFLLPEDKQAVDGTDIAVIHYTTESKPWQAGAMCLFKEYYTNIEAQLAKISPRQG